MNRKMDSRVDKEFFPYYPPFYILNFTFYILRFPILLL